MAIYSYCRCCKKFTQRATFSFTCKVCKNTITKEDRIQSVIYYNANKDKPNFAELEANYENYLEGKKQQKEDLKNNITASDTIAGKEIVEVLGIVNGSDNYNPAGLIGEGYTDKMGNIYMQGAIDRATAKMVAAAALKEADAIISFKTTTSNAGLNNVLVTVTGTAVKVKDSNNVIDSEIVSSSADEILKFKQLLDNGIISQEEFEAKKKQLLGV